MLLHIFPPLGKSINQNDNKNFKQNRSETKNIVSSPKTYLCLKKCIKIKQNISLNLKKYIYKSRLWLGLDWMMCGCQGRSLPSSSDLVHIRTILYYHP